LLVFIKNKLKMENTTKKGLDQFLENEKDENEKVKTINQKDGLIERIDIKYVTNNGKQLLKEIYR